MFVLNILVIKGKNTNPCKSDAFGGFAVALGLLAAITLGTRIGPCFNPSVGIAQTIYQKTQFGDGFKATQYMWAYTVGPAVGGAFAGVA